MEGKGFFIGTMLAGKEVCYYVFSGRLLMQAAAKCQSSTVSSQTETQVVPPLECQKVARALFSESLVRVE